MSENTGSFGEFVSNNHGVDLSANDSFGEFLDNYDPTPKPAGLGTRAVNTAQALGRLAYDTPGNLASYAANLSEGSRPLDKTNWADQATADATKRLNERTSAHDANDPTLLGTKSDWAQTGASVPFSVGSMGAALGAGGLTTAITKNPFAGYAAGAGAAGSLAYRADTSMFMNSAIDAFTTDYQNKNNGQAPSRDVLLAEQERLQPYAQDHGLWEALPEAAGSVVGGKIVSSVFKGTGNLAWKAGKIAAGLALEELPTETITQHGQHNTEIDAGIAAGEKRSFTSPSDVSTSFGEVVTPVLQQSLLMGGGGSAVKAAYDYAAARKQKLEQTASTGPLGGALANGGFTNEGDHLADSNLDLRTDEQKAQDNASVIDSTAVNTNQSPTLHTSSYDQLFQQAESNYGLPAGLLSTMGFHESGFDPNAVSSAGARGVMQFMPATAQEYGIDPHDTPAAINAAGKKMSGLINYYKGDISKAIAAYNFGEGNVDKTIARAGDNWQDELPPETQVYLSRILGGQEATTTQANTNNQYTDNADQLNNYDQSNDQQTLANDNNNSLASGLESINTLENPYLSTQAGNQNGSQKTDESTNETSTQEKGSLLNTDAPEQSGVTSIVDNAPHDPLVSVIDRNTGTAFNVLQSDLESDKDKLTKHSVKTGKRLLTPILRQDIVDEQTYQQELTDKQKRQNEQTNKQTETQAQDQTGADQGTYVAPSYATAPLLNKRTNKPFKTRKMAEAAIASSSNPTLNKQDHIAVPVDGGFGITPKPNTTQESNDTTAETQSVLSNTGTNAKRITAPATTDVTGQASNATAQEVKAIQNKDSAPMLPDMGATSEQLDEYDRQYREYYDPGKFSDGKNERSQIDLSNKSDAFQALIDKKHDELDAQGISWDDQKKDAELHKLYSQRTRIDKEAMHNAYKGIRRVILGAVRNHTIDYRDSDLPPGWNSKVTEGRIEQDWIDYLIENEYHFLHTLGAYSAKELTDSLGQKKTIEGVAERIAKQTMAKDNPIADYDMSMNSNMSGLSWQQKDKIKNDATQIAEEIDQGINDYLAGSSDNKSKANQKSPGQGSTQTAQEVAKKPDWEMTRDEYKNSFDPRDYKDSNYDFMLHKAVIDDNITKAEADKKLIRDYTGNKYHWAKTRKELEQEKKEAVKNAKAARAEGNKNPIHSVKWAQKSASNTAKNNITSTNLYHNKLLEVHQERVQEALSEGKSVPQEVLADYPDLQSPVQETANPIHDNADVSKKGENVDTYHQQTIDEFLSDAKKELGADFDGLKPSLINEHYQSIEDHIKDGGKISQAVYDSLETGKQHHFNKTFGAENVIDDGTRQAELDKLNKISDSKLAKDNEVKAQEEKEFADKKKAVAIHQADETVRMAQYDVDHYGASESNQLKLDQAIKSRDALGRADNTTATKKLTTKGTVVADKAEATEQPVEDENVLSKEKIISSYQHRSMGGVYNKVEMERTWHEKAVQALQDKLEPLARSEQQKELAKTLVDQFRKDYVTHRHNALRVGESVISSAVAGGSNFNHKQSAKRGNSLDRAETAFNTWLDSELLDAEFKIQKIRTPEDRDEDNKKAETIRVNKLIKPVITDLAMIGSIDEGLNKGMNRTSFALGAVRKIKNLYQANETEALSKVFKSINTWDENHKKPLFSSTNSVWQYQPEATEEATQGNFDAVKKELVKKAPVTKSEPTTALKAHNDFIDKLDEGTVTAEELKAAFELAVTEKETIYAELNKLSKDEIVKQYGSAYLSSSDKKERYVNHAYHQILMGYRLQDGMFSYGGGESSFINAIRDDVNKTTDENIKDYADDRKKALAERLEARQSALAGMENPTTFSDYVRIINSKIKDDKLTQKEAIMSLPIEQREAFDKLWAEKTRTERSAKADQQKAQMNVAATTTDGQIVETNHTKTGEALFVVKAADRVEKDVYTLWNNTAKRLGGYYSSFRGAGAVPGFQFKSMDNAEAFLKFIGGDATDAKEMAQVRRDVFADDRSQSASERLIEMADKLEEKADESIGQDRKENTPRRARQAAAREASDLRDKAMASTMRNIAEAISNGTANLLDRVRQKTQVEMLQGFVSSAQNIKVNKLYVGQGDRSKHDGEKPNSDTASYVEFPDYTIWRSNLADMGRKLIEIEGFKKLGTQILKEADDVSKAYLVWAKDNILKVSNFTTGNGSKLASFGSKNDAEIAISRSGFKGQAIVIPFKRGDNRIILSPSEAIKRGLWEGDDKMITLNPSLGAELVEKIGKKNRKLNAKDKINLAWQLENAYEKRKRLSAMGIETPAELRTAVREFIALRVVSKETSQIKEMERAMIGRANDGMDFFPTPAKIADEMIEAADIQPGMSVLEPSAGMGHIAERLREAGHEADVVEMSNSRKELLEAKGFNVVGSDFMDLKPRDFFMWGDTFKAPDGKVGIMKNTVHGGSGVRVRLIDSNGDQLGFYNRDDLVGVQKNGVDSGYDRIIMNPPFGDRRDAAHVQHAYDLLSPNGRLVAIMGEGVFFGKDKTATAFRDWLEQLGGTEEKLPNGSFTDPSLPVNTGVNARMVVIDKIKTTGDVKFSKSTTPVVNPHSKTSLNQAVTKAMDTLFGQGWTNRLMATGKFKVISRDEAVQIAGSTAANAKGFFNSDTDITYLVYDNIEQDASSKALVGLMLHEISTHSLNLGKSSEAFQDILRRFEALKATNPKVQAAFANVPASTPDEHKVEEALAEYLAENPRSSLAQRIVEWFRQAVRALGKTLPVLERAKFSQWANKLTEAELIGMATSSLKSAPDSLQFDNVGRNREGIKLSGDNKKLLAPNGKPSNLNAMQHAQVRTEAFKKWFGDWETAQIIHELKNGKPFIVIGNEFADFSEPLNMKKLRSESITYGESNIVGKYENKYSGIKLEVRRGGIDESIQHGSGPEKLKALASIKDILVNGYVVYDGINPKNKKGRLVAISKRVNISGKSFVVTVGLREDANGRLFYDHELLDTRRAEGLSSQSSEGLSPQHPAPTSTRLSDYYIRFIEKDTNSSKVVDENGEPLVVYHGTDKSFDSFDIEATAKNRTGNPTGIYLTPSKDEAKYFGSNVFNLFAIAANPYIEGESKVNQKMANTYAQILKDNYPNYGDDWIDNTIIPEFKKTGRFKDIQGAFKTRVMKAGGFDSWKDGRHIDVFGPNQIKSATENNGDFSQSNNNIKFSRSTPSNTTADNSAMRSFFAPAKGKQALGWLAGFFQRNHLIDFVAKDLPELINYKLLSQEKDNFTNQRENEIGKSYKEMMDKMDKKTMHELGRVQGMATRLVKFDPALADDNTPMTEEELAVYDAYTAMPDSAKEVYATMRKAYQDDLTEKKEALKERIRAFPADKETQAEIIRTIEEHFDQFKEGVYFPLNRDGAVIVKATNADGDLVIEHVATQADAYKLIKEMQDQGYENTHILGKDAYDRDLLAGNAANEMAALAHRTISDLKEKSVQGKLTDADFNDLFSEFNQLLINTLPDSSYRKHFIHRKGTLGESTDTLRAYAKTRTSAVKMIASLTYDHQIQAVLNDADKTIKEMDKVPGSDTLAIKSILNELKLREAALKSTEINAMSQVLTSLGFMGALGFNIGSAAVNMLQVMGVALPELSGRHSEIEAIKEISAAYKLLFNPTTLDKASGFDITKNPHLTAIAKQAMERLASIGKIDLTMTHDSIAAGKNPSYSSNLMTRSLGSAAKYSGYFFHVAEAANRQITGMAAFNLAYQKNGGNFEAAIAEAVDVIDRTQFDYGQGNRARYMMSNTARVLTLFKAYALGMSYYIGRNAYQSMKGETPEVRLQARKTLVVSMAMSFATAGLFGMPIGIEAFAGIGGVAAFKYKGAYFAVPGAIGGMLIFRALLEGLGADDDDELETEFRNWLTDNFDQTTAEWVTKGPARLLPIGDISGRTSLSELWWRSQNKQLEGTDQYNAIATALIGPIGSQIAGLFTAKKMYEDGQYSRMVESMSPAFMRNAIAATRMSQDGVRNLKGDKIIERDLTPVELINKVIGFNPTVVTNTYDANSAIAKESTKHTLAKSHLVNRWLSGNATERSDLMKADIKDFNESVSPSERITLKNLFASMKARKGIDKHTQNGLYLSKKQNYLRDIGRFNRQE